MLTYDELKLILDAIIVHELMIEDEKDAISRAGGRHSDTYLKWANKQIRLKALRIKVRNLAANARYERNEQ